jgi:branched-chain amino acid transport system permease protein
MLLFLVASGLTLVFGMMRVLNIAHAAFYVLGAYLAYTVVHRTGNLWLAMILVPVVAAALGAIVEVLLLRRSSRLGHAYDLLLTFGLYYMISEAILWAWGTTPLEVAAPSALQGAIPLLGGRYPVYRLFILGGSLAILAVMAFVLLRTRLGIVVRSTVSDGAMVEALGIDASMVRVGVFAAGTALAAFAGVIAAPFLQAYPGMGATILIDSFVVVVLGGFGSLAGALVAAIIIGMLQSFGVLFLPEFAQVFQFLLMAIVLVVRPQGLFGERS